MKLEPDEFVAAAKALAQRLRAVEAISELTSGKHDEPEVLSNSLLSIAEACEAFIEQEPLLLGSDLPEDAFTQMLSRLLLELHNILYGVESSRYLRRMFNPLQEEWRASN